MIIDNEIQTISVHQLQKKYENNKSLCLIDVRELHEWQENHIPWAIHIPKDELPMMIQEKILDKNEPIYLHCHSGVRSIYAANCLLQLGYKEVYSVTGGIVEWIKSGYPIKIVFD